MDSAVPAPEAAAPPVDALPAQPPAPPAETPAAFASRPVLNTFVGRAYSYRPTFSGPGPWQILVKKGPDSMRVEQGRINWLPPKEGRFAVILEATGPARDGESGPVRLQQGFTLNVKKVLWPAMRPFPARINKDDTLTFDLRGSGFPPWALPSLTLRFDYDGDGNWDTPELPLAAHLAHRKVYGSTGNFAPRVEMKYQDWESAVLDGKVAVVGSVDAVLKISPDSAEPGTSLTVDASASKGDGRLSYRLDLDGDGKVDWEDSASGKTVMKAPASGVYKARLTARNPMGQEGAAVVAFRVNARPKLELQIVPAKVHMAAAVEMRVKAWDPDDSLRQLKTNFLGDAAGWQPANPSPDSAKNPHQWTRRFRHVYGRTGKFSPAACIAAADGREVCRQAAVEVFNAPPQCKPGADLRATLGVPLEIEGGGEDPDGKIVKWEWDLNGDGKFELVSRDDGKFQYTFAKEGVFPLALKVTTADGASATGKKNVEVRKKWKR